MKKKYENIQAYMKAKEITEDAFKAMSGEDQANVYNEYNNENFRAGIDAMQKEMKEANDQRAVELKEMIVELNSELTKVKDEQYAQLNAKLKEQGIALQKVTREERELRAKAGTVTDQIKKGLQDNLEKLKGLKEMATAQGSQFVMKVVGDMTFANSVSGGNIPVEDRLTGLNLVPVRQVRLLDIIARGSTTSNVISWVYQANKDGSTGGTAEAATKNQIDFDLVVDSENVIKRTNFIKVSDEMIDDIPFLETEINNELLRELLLDLEDQTYQGDGTGTNLNGIKTLATAFAAGSFALAVDNANNVDVLTVAINQVMIAEQPMPTAILMHPSDVTALKLVKATDDQYIDRLQIAGSTMSLDGIPIIATTLVTQDDYLVGVFNLNLLVSRQEIDIQVGLDGNDFTKNMRTIRAEWRGANIIRNNDRSAFVDGDFTTDKAALETA